MAIRGRLSLWGALLVLPLIALTGCGYLPVHRLEGLGIVSRVIDAQTGAPVPKAVITDVLLPCKSAHADTAGLFRLKPHYQWRVNLPWSDYAPNVFAGMRQVRVASPGYKEQVFLVMSEQDGADPHVTRGSFEPKDRPDTIRIPLLPLRRLDSPATQPSLAPNAGE